MRRFGRCETSAIESTTPSFRHLSRYPAGAEYCHLRYSISQCALGQLTDEQARKIVLDQLTHIRDELRASRLALETIALAPGEGLKLMPSEWQIDLNRNGEIETWKKYFFTIQKRGGSSFAFNIPNDSEEYYRGESLLSAVIQVDSSDIAWSLSYHYFIESLVEMVLA